MRTEEEILTEYKKVQTAMKQAERKVERCNVRLQELMQEQFGSIDNEEKNNDQI